MRRQFPYKTQPCSHCNETTQWECPFCLGSGREIKRISDEQRIFEAAVSRFRQAAAGFRATIARFGGAK